VGPQAAAAAEKAAKFAAEAAARSEGGKRIPDRYFSGRYDRTCECCKGLRVVQVIDRDLADPDVIKRYDEKMQFDAENAAMRQAEMRMGC
jgi:hypothetical protein